MLACLGDFFVAFKNAVEKQMADILDIDGTVKQRGEALRGFVLTSQGGRCGESVKESPSFS